MKSNGTKIVSSIVYFALILFRLANASEDCISSRTAAGKLQIDCNNMNLVNFPHNLPASTNILLLRNNQIKIVPSLAGMSLTQLEELDLSFNNIQSLSNETFLNLSQLDALDLRYNSLFDSVMTPVDVFRPLTVLKTLKLTCSMSSDLQKSLLLATVSVLKNLEQFYITGSTDVSAATLIAAQLDSLENLDLFDCSFANISIKAMSPLRSNLKLKTISLRNCGIKTVQEGSFSDLPFVETLSLACNERLGFKDALKSLADFDVTASNLSTVVLDHLVDGQSSVMLRKEMVCMIPILDNIRRFAIQSNHIIGFQVGLEKCLNSTEVLSLGYNVFFIQEPEYPGGPIYPSLQFMRLFPRNVVQLSMTHHFNEGRTYLDRYCKAPTAADVEIDDFFPPQPELDFEDIFPEDQKTLSNTIDLSTIRGERTAGEEPLIAYFPPKLKYLYADNIGMQQSPMSFVIPEVIYNPDNTLKYLNLSNGNMHVRELRGPAKGVEHLEVFDANGLAVERLSSYWATDMIGLRKLYINRNLLGNMAPDEFAGFCKGASNMEDLDLSFNVLTKISVNTFSELKSLKKINLAGNQLKDLKVNLTYVKDLQFLSLAQNTLDQLNEFLTEQLDFVYQTSPAFTLDLRQNSFVCGCNNIPFVRWFQRTKITIPDKEIITCRQNWIPGSEESIPIDLVPLQEVIYHCNEFKRFMTIVGTLVSFVCLAILLSGIIMYRYRWRLRWKYYLVRRWMRNYLKRRRRAEEKSLLEPRFDRDAFVVCTINSKDSNFNSWLTKTLPNKAEKPEDDQISKFTLYIFGRDAPAGDCQYDLGYEVLFQVKRILIILHPSCIADRFWEFITMLALTNRHEDTMVLELGKVDFKDWPQIMRNLVAEKQIVKRCFWSENQDSQRQFWNELWDFLDNRPQDDD